MKEASREISASGRFVDVHQNTLDWDKVFGRDEYLELLSTFSDHMVIDAEVRHRLFSAIGI